jgi:hypothetical protein
MKTYMIDNDHLGHVVMINRDDSWTCLTCQKKEEEE